LAVVPRRPLELGKTATNSMKLRDLSLRTKLVSAFALLTLIILVVSTQALRALSTEHQSFTAFVGETGLRMKLANDILDAANARAVSARNLVLVTTPEDAANEKAAVAKAHERVERAFAVLKTALEKTRGVTEQERKLFAALEDVEAKYGPVALNIVALALDGKKDAAVAKMNADCRPLLAALIAAADEYIQAIEAEAQAEIKDSEAAYSLNLALLVVGCVLAVVASGVMTVFLTRSIVGPIGRAVQVAKTVASGDLRSRIDILSKDETGELLGALTAMNQSLVDIVTNVRQSSESIATGSAQIATGNSDLSSRTEQQASNLQQTAASMEEMTATVRNNAATAQQATSLASDASRAAVRGGEVVGQVVATMDEIAAGSRRIAEIIGVIDGIAFQTNILALNAAVEAARAGEQGRGFAVVAGEVRNLAQRSAEAAKEIKSLIGTSVERVDAGTKFVADARASMDDIVTQVQRVSTLIGEIGTATAEQTEGIGQVNSAVSDLDRATQQNAALVEESAAAAESLKQQAARLAHMVGVFRLA